MNEKKSDSESTLHKLNFLRDAKHSMQAEIARKDLSLNEVMLWKQGSVVVFDKIVGSTIDVLIGDRLIARGEVVGARLQPVRNTNTFNIRWIKFYL